MRFLSCCKITIFSIIIAIMKQLFRTLPYKYSYLGVCISLSCVCIRLSCVCIRLSCVRISLKKEATDKDVERNACSIIRLSALLKSQYSCREAENRTPWMPTDWATCVIVYLPFGLTSSACLPCLYISSWPSMSGSIGFWRSVVLWALSRAGPWDGGARRWLSACGRRRSRSCASHSCCIPRCGIHSSGATALTMWLGWPCFPPCIGILPCAVVALLFQAYGWLFLHA